jgi:hypothetical protein
MITIAVVLAGCAPRPTQPPGIDLPPGMGAVVGGIEACYDSGPPSGGYPFVAGTVGAYRGSALQPIGIGYATRNTDFVVLVPPGNYQLAPFASNLPNPDVSVTVWTGHITLQDLPSDGCI